MMKFEDDGLNRPASRAWASVIKIALCGASDVQRDELRTALSQVTELNLELAENSTFAASTAEGSELHICITILNDDREMWPLQIQELVQSEPGPAIIAAISDRSGEAVRHALRAGADEVLFLPLEQGDVERCLVKICETRQHKGGTRTGAVCSLMSVAGGVGVSSITAAIGLALRRLTQRRVALVDLGLQCSALSAVLDLDPEHTWTELTDPTSKIDSIRLESILCAHESGLHLLAAPKRIEESENDIRKHDHGDACGDARTVRFCSGRLRPSA
jgi:pilus assembly protein CpaE